MMALFLVFLAPWLIIGFIAYFCGGVYSWAVLDMTSIEYTHFLVNTIVLPVLHWAWQNWWALVAVVVIAGLFDGVMDALIAKPAEVME